MELFKSKCTSQYYGVSYVSEKRKFNAHIQINNKVIQLGYYNNELDGAVAYDNAVKLNGLNRRLNFPEPEPYNPIPNTRLIRLTQGKFAVVDEEDFEKINQYKWSAIKGKSTYYAIRTIHVGGKSKHIWMHRFIMGESDLELDHKNKDGLHNYKSNLRYCTETQNLQNKRSYHNCSSKYKGVTWRANDNKFQARINHNKKSIHIGMFDNEIEAAASYDTKAKELFGEFACLNFSE
jgi:hypothetical protein